MKRNASNDDPFYDEETDQLLSRVIAEGDKDSVAKENTPARKSVVSPKGLAPSPAAKARFEIGTTPVSTRTFRQPMVTTKTGVDPSITEDVGRSPLVRPVTTTPVINNTPIGRYSSKPPQVDPKLYLTQITSLQAKLDKVIGERDGLQAERDSLAEDCKQMKGKLLFAEHQLKENQRELIECREELMKERKCRINEQQTLAKFRRRSDEEISSLRAEIQFQRQEEFAQSFR